MSTALLDTHQLYPLRDTGQADNDEHLWNWALNARVGRVNQLQRPRNEDELRWLLNGHRGKVRVQGSRLSPGRMLRLAEPADLLLDLSAMSGLLDQDDRSVTFAGGTPLTMVHQTLTDMNRMLASSPGVIAMQTLAGAISTGTHGQGLNQCSLADEALAIRLVLADGSVRTLTRDDADFPAVQVGLGALGVVTAVTLRTVPLSVFTCHKDAVSADGLEQDLLRWNEGFAQSKAWWFVDDNRVHVWNARHASPEEARRYRQNGRHTIEHDAADSSLNHTINKTLEQMHRDTQVQGNGGKQFRTVTRFRDFTDITGDIYQVFCRGIAVPQINVEIGVPLDRAAEIISKLKCWYAQHRPHMHYPIILRCTGASSAWLSPAYQRPTCFFGFVVYYADDGSLSPEGLEFLTEVEKLLAAEGGRPHWGKYFDPRNYDWRNIYPHWDAFWAVRDRCDRQHKFSNEYIARLSN
jgi:FAD/FMN-containing dehydrogenase